MALRFIDGFDYYNNSQITRKWNRNDGGGATQLTATNARTGNCMRFTTNRGVAIIIDKQTVWTVGFAMLYEQGIATEFSLLTIYDNVGGNNQIIIKLSDGNLKVQRGSTVLGTAYTSLNSNVYYYIELKVLIDPSAGYVVLRVNGNVVLSLTGQNTRNTANTFADTIILNDDGLSPGDGSSTWCCDDLYICDGTGTVNNDFIGDVKVETALANGAGANTQFNKNGAATNWQCVNENPADDDTTYVNASGVNKLDTYTFPSLSGVPKTIFGVQTNMVARKNDVTSRSGCAVAWISSTEFDGSGVPFGNTYSNITQMWQTAPNGTGLWSTATFNSAQFGIKIAG